MKRKNVSCWYFESDGLMFRTLSEAKYHLTFLSVVDLIPMHGTCLFHVVDGVIISYVDLRFEKDKILFSRVKKFSC